MSGGKAPKKELGSGHVFRSLNLAELLGKKQIFFLVEDYGGVKEILKRKKIKNIFFITKKGNLSYDTKRTIQLIKKIKPDVTIIDKYKTDVKYVKNIRKHCKVVYIADLYNIDFPADLIINGFIGFDNDVVLNKYSAKCLIGPSYQILNKRFIKKIKNEKRYKLLATFGGYDENNLTEILMKELIKLENKIKVKIILGPSTLKSKNIKNLQKRLKDFVEIVKYTDNMSKEISTAEFGLCSGGLTTYEFASMGIPFGILCQVNHQLKTAKVWEQRGVAKNLGMINSQTSRKIGKFLQKISTNEIESEFVKTVVVNGQGTKQIVKEINKLNRNF